MEREKAIHNILLGFHNNTETFQSANEKIQALIKEECNAVEKIWKNVVDKLIN